jgi:hypothetical protein
MTNPDSQTMLPITVLHPPTENNGGLVRFPSGREIILSKADAAAIRTIPAPAAMREANDVLIFDHSVNTFLEDYMMTFDNEIRQALARGYCHSDNTSKELDAHLIEAMTTEVLKVVLPKISRLEDSIELSTPGY